METTNKEVKILQHFVNGRDFSGNSNRFQDIHDPSNAECIAKAPLANQQDVATAVAQAKKAFPAWANTPPAKRAAIMFRFRELLLKNSGHIAEILSREHGKTLEDASGSLARGIEVVEFCTSITTHLRSDFSAQVSSNIDSYNLRQPLGVCAGITPFNFPAMVPMWMFPVALSAGNTFVLKPSEKDPSTSLYLAKLLSQAGLPDGVLNVVIGDKITVDAILEHDDIKAVSFVGSTAVGEYIYHKGSANNKRVQALCGAKNHMLIMPDADIEKTAQALIGSVYGSAGERCMAVSVAVTVGDEVADALLQKLIPKVKNLKIGPYYMKGVEMGPLITKESLERTRGYLKAGQEQGATLVLNGDEHKLQVQGCENGYFIGGSIFDKVKPNMSIYTDEIFGPVLSIVRAASYQEALELINNHEYGNGAAIFTKSGAAARHFTHNVQIGMVGVNVPIPVPVAYHSFGGWKRSLFGSSAIHGMEGIRFYTKLKTVTARWLDDVKDMAQFHFKAGSDS